LAAAGVTKAADKSSAGISILIFIEISLKSLPAFRERQTREDKRV
jgi:hypothetical protein